MEECSFFRNGNGYGYDFVEFVYAVNKGQIDKNERILVYNNHWRTKRYMKAKNILKWSFYCH